MRQIRCICATLIFAVLAACSTPPPSQGDDVAQLAREIMQLGPDVDPVEATRAAHVAYQHAHDLALAYEITDPPLIHNSKVNMGIKPRGLCWHWAEDMQKRLASEQFTTLAIHRAIANADNPFRIDHSTALVAARGDAVQEGIVLDPWRFGGRLFWSPLGDDPTYEWHTRQDALARKYGITPVKQDGH